MLRFSFCIMPVFAVLVQSADACTAPKLTAGPSDAPKSERSTMSAGATDPVLQLQGNWTLTKIANEAAPKGATLAFTAGQLNAFVGCNTISAVPMLGQSSVRFRDVTTTKMACAPDVQALEAQVMDALSRIGSMQVGAGDVLSFYDGLNGLQLGAQRAE